MDPSQLRRHKSKVSISAVEDQNLKTKRKRLERLLTIQNLRKVKMIQCRKMMLK